jgi:hypothetical protein
LDAIDANDDEDSLIDEDDKSDEAFENEDDKRKGDGDEENGGNNESDGEKDEKSGDGDQETDQTSFRTKMELLNMMKERLSELDAKSREAREIKRAITALSKQPGGPATKYRSFLYLVVPKFNGKIIGFGKFGWSKIPEDCENWIKYINKHGERYGTPYKDFYVFM